LENNVAICSDCIELCNNLIEDENLVTETPNPKEESHNDPSAIKDYLDLHVKGNSAKEDIECSNCQSL
jgi:ATP-dependent protease Clp ATPase subunit